MENEEIEGRDESDRKREGEERGEQLGCTRYANPNEAGWCGTSPDIGVKNVPIFGDQQCQVVAVPA